MILVIDNYDSFVYNLVQYVGELGEESYVVRNDRITLEEAEHLAPSHIVLSPGPCTPNEAGVTLDIVRRFAGRRVPILGVCLGHQAIGQAFGARVVKAPRLMHGKTSLVEHDGQGIHHGIPNPFQATRYHSLVLDPESIPDVLRVTAWTKEGDVMAVAHRDYPVVGVQYHPESIVTEYGHDILRNFLAIGLSPHATSLHPS